MAHKQLRNNIHSLIEGLSVIQDVKRTAGLDFSGYPAVFISPGDTEGRYESTQENMRTIPFRLWLLEEFDTKSHDQAEDNMLDALEAILNAIDEQESPNSDRELADSLDDQYTLTAVEAAATRFITDETEKKLGQEIIIRCKVLVDLTQLS